MAWLLNEDAALKFRLQGLQVFDANAPQGRDVDVRYRLPTDELANLTYPVIIIEHAGIYPDQDRMQAGVNYQLPYAPDGLASWTTEGQTVVPATSPYYAFYAPTPYNLDYQITLYARFWSTQVQPLVAELATLPRLPAKIGALFVPQDGTLRTIRLLGGPEEGYGTDEDGKRLFKVVYRLRVFSELPEYINSSIYFGGTLVPVTTVDIDLSVYSDTGNIDLATPAGIAQNTGYFSAGLQSSTDIQN
jgi:hypothetical protein